MTHDATVDPEVDALGPIDCLAVEFPDGRIVGEGFGALLALVEAGVVDILDLEFFAKRADGRVESVEVGELDVDGFDLTVFDGASSGVLDRSDVDEIAAAMAPGSVAAVLVYEERSLIPIVAAWQRGGARVISDHVVTPEELLAALDSTEPT